MKKTVIFFFSFTLILFSCTHINNLEDYNLIKKVIFFETVVEGNAAELHLDFGESNSNGKIGKLNLVKDALVSVLLTPEIYKKLQKAYSPDSIVNGISNGIQLEMKKYLRTKGVHKLDDNIQFIVTTTLKSCKLFSSNSNIYISVEILTQIFDRETANLVWQNGETETKRLRFNYSDNFTPDNNVIYNYIQISKLASLSEQQIKLSIIDAAVRAGKEIAIVFREDISDIRNE